MDTMHAPLTDRQQQVLDYIHAHQRQQGVSPSLREIQAHFGLASPFGVKRHVVAQSRGSQGAGGNGNCGVDNETENISTDRTRILLLA